MHVIISTPRWTELKSRVRDYLGTKIEFRLGDVNETQIDRITREIPANRPGRAISMEKHHLMMGVPRLDGVHSADNLVAAMSEAVHVISARTAEQAPRVRVLPERIHLHDLDPNPPGRKPGQCGGVDAVFLGQDAGGEPGVGRPAAHAAQRAFGRIVVDLDAAVVAVARQRLPAGQAVADGARQV